MIEFLIAYLMYEGEAGMEWWALFAALVLYKLSYLYKKMLREKEEELVIKKIINAEVINKDISSNH
jgi:hypothetical protein